MRSTGTVLRDIDLEGQYTAKKGLLNILFILNEF